jgi:hypothetical protein
MTVAIQQTGDRIRAVLAICHSPAFTSAKPTSKTIRGYFSEAMQYTIKERFSFYQRRVSG